MRTFINIPEQLTATKVNMQKVATLSGVALVTGIAIYLLLMSEFKDNSILSAILTLVALAGVITCLIMVFSLKQVVHSESNSPFVNRTLDFSESKYGAIKEAVANQRWNELPTILQGGSGAIMKLDILYTKDKGFAAYQFFQYVPHTFEPCSEIVYIEKENIQKL